MSSSNTNGADVAQNKSNTASTVESETSESGDGKSENVTETSPKQLQAIKFLSKIETALESYLKAEQFSDCRELQNVIKDLAIVLKNGEKETQQCVVEMLNKDDNKVVFLLKKVAFGLFKATVMQGVPLSPQHSLILAYYCVSMIDPTEKFVKDGIIPLIVHHLKVMELFMTLTEEDLTLAKLLISILCSYCDLESAQTVMVQSGAHYALTYYIHTFGFNTVLLAKSALAMIVNKVEEHFQRFVKLTDTEVLQVQAVLATSVQTKNLHVELTDRQGPSDYYIIGFLGILQQLAVNPDNKLSLGSSNFIGLYHCMLVEPELYDAAKSVLLLLKAVCGHPANKVLQQENILATLETFTDNESLAAIATEVIWTILEDSPTEIKQVTNKDGGNDVKEDKIASVLKILLSTAKFFFLRNETASQVTKMEFHEVKTLFAEIFCFLRYLMALSEHFTIAVIEKCSSQIQSMLKVISDYCTWMICREKLLEKSEWSLMHPLFLFHFLFYFLITICDDGKKQLRDSGVIKLIINELWMIQLIPTWHKGISKLAELILIILLKCFEFIPQELLCAGLLEQFCIEEEFIFRISAKPLLAAFSKQKSYNFKLVELLESEASTLWNLLKKSSKDPKKVMQVVSHLKDCIILHVSFLEVEFIISSLLRANPTNQKIFYNCCIHEAVDVLDNVCSSIRPRVENLIAFMMDEHSIADLNGSSSTTEEYNEVIYWMCRVTTSIRAILSDNVDDNLAEEYVPLEEDSLFVVGQKDLLFSDLFKLTEFSITQLGIEAFQLFLLQMPQFSILLKSLLKLSFKRIQGNNSHINVPGSSLFRLERVFSLFQDHCQKSSEFCEMIAHRGIIADLINGLLVLFACQTYRSIDFEWILLHLAEPILYILAVCAENQSLHTHMRHLPKVLEWYCKVNSERCGALAKISLSMLHSSAPIATEDFELSDPEIYFVFELLSSVIYKEENEDYTWIAYTTTSNDSVYYFITFCLHLVTNSSNAMKLLRAGILDCISFLFQHYKQEILLKTALQLLAKLSTLVKVSTESHSTMISSMQQLMQRDSLKLDVFYCLLTLGIDVPKITDLPDGYSDAVAMFRIEKYHDCIDKLQEMIQGKADFPYRIQMIQTLGESYYMLYTMKPSSQRSNKSKHHHAKDGNSEHYKNAKQAIKYLGDAYDHQLFIDEDINSMHLDFAMMDCIFHTRDKPLSRCLLCRRKCGKGERLIRSHIWPEALLRHFIDGLPSGSKQMFDPSWKGTGNLEGPGQIHFTMLCKACENLFSKYEKAFKSLCFDKLYRKDTKPHTVTNDTITMSMVKAPGIPQNWLYLFCLSIAFRMFVVASQGCPTPIIGNFKSWYNCFTLWREILLREGSTQCKLAPKIAFFISPVNVMEDLSPPMAKVLFSPGTGAFCSYRLYDGVNISNSKAEFLLSSIGAINIVVSCDNACFNFIPSECVVTLDSLEFVIPSAIRRYLLFPKGIWMTYKSISALVTERMLNIAQDKVKAPFNKTWIDKEMKLFSGALGESFDASQVSLNFLPAPFDKGSPLQQVATILETCAAFRTILHLEEVEMDTEYTDIICDDWFNTLIVRNNDQEAFPELFAIFIFQNKSYKISVAYELSTVDLSVKDAIQPSSTKAFLPQVECYFEIKTLLQGHLVKAITKAGFTDMTLFVKWLKDFKSSSYCDLRCFPYCFACFDVCSCCMQTIPVADAIPIYYDGKAQAKIAIACDSQCYNYLTSTTSMPVILYKPEENVTVNHLVLQACTNGALFGFTDPKGKFIIYYFTSENDNTITVWCQYRLWCTQYIYTMLCDDSFNAIADHPTGFNTLFSDSESKRKFTRFVKEVWQFYQSLLVKPAITDDMACPQNDENTVRADEGFQYFATIPTDRLSFHSPHAQSEEIDQSGQDDDHTACTV